jgi:hypothetical protein
MLHWFSPCWSPLRSHKTLLLSRQTTLLATSVSIQRMHSCPALILDPHMYPISSEGYLSTIISFLYLCTYNPNIQSNPQRQSQALNNTTRISLGLYLNGFPQALNLILMELFQHRCEYVYGFLQIRELQTHVRCQES